MFLDSQNQFSADQNLTATGVSTNVIDLSQDRDIGKGEPMGVVLTFASDVGGTSPSVTVQVQTDDNEGFSSPTNIAISETVVDALEGQSIVVPIGHTNEQYLRLNLVLAGTSPDATFSAYLQPMSMIDGYVDYASGYVIE